MRILLLGSGHPERFKLIHARSSMYLDSLIESSLNTDPRLVGYDLKAIASGLGVTREEIVGALTFDGGDAAPDAASLELRRQLIGALDNCMQPMMQSWIISRIHELRQKYGQKFDRELLNIMIRHLSLSDNYRREHLA